MMSLREAVRKRPGMYFGSIQTSHGRVIALGYLFDLLYAGAQRGQAREIHLTLHADRSFTLWSNGPAPLGLFQLEDPFAETEPYQHDPAWLARFVCAAASHFHIDSYAEGLHHERTFQGGIPTGPWRAREASERTGTRFHVQLDPDIFTGEALPFAGLARTFHMRAACVPGLALRLTDETSGQSRTLCCPEGLRDYLLAYTSSPTARHPTPFRLQAEGVEVALWWQREPGQEQCSFANGEATPEGGTHVEGLLAGLGQVFHRYHLGMGKVAIRPAAQDIAHRLTYGVSVWLEEPQYPGSFKTELGNVEAHTAVRDLIVRALPPLLAQSPELTFQVLYAAYADARRRVTKKRRARQWRLGPRKALPGIVRVRRVG